MTAEIELRFGPPKLPTSRHVFDLPVWVSQDITSSGRGQTERTCKVCGAVKVTLHGHDVGRAWRASQHAPQVETFVAPVCVPVGTAP